MENRRFESALYNLARDPGERYDVKDLFPERVAILEKVAEQARNELGDDLQNKTGNGVREAGKVAEKD